MPELNPTDLADCFVAELASDAPRSELAEALAALLAHARRAWPTLDVPDHDFVRHVAARCEPAGSLVDALAALRADDLYLAFACSRRLPPRSKRCIAITSQT